MASEQARKLVEEMLAGGARKTEISSGAGNRGMPAPGAIEYDRPTAGEAPGDPWHKRALETIAPAAAATMVGGPLGAATRIPGARLAGETLASAGLGALGFGGGPSGAEGAQEAAEGNLYGAGLEALARPLLRRIPGVRGGFATIPGAREADLALRAGGGEGLLLSQAFESPVVASAERLLTEAQLLGGRGALGRAGQRANQTARDMAEDYAKGIVGRGDRQEIGQVIEGFLTKKYDAFRAASHVNYAKVDELARNVTVDIEPLQREAARLMEEGEIIGPGVNTIVKHILGQEGRVPFSVAARLRSSLLAIGREGESMQPEQAHTFAKRLAPIAEQQMDRAANALDPATGASASPGAWQAYLAAREFHRHGVEPFQDEGIRAIMRRQPEAVAQYLVPLSGNFKISAIQALKRASGNDPTAMEALRGHYVSELLRSSRNDAADAIARYDNPASTQYVSGKKLLDQLNRDRRGMEELLGVQGYRRWLSLADAMAKTEKAPGAGGVSTFGTGLRFARLGAAVGGNTIIEMGGPALGGGTVATLVVGPVALNHMLASPVLRAWLIGGKAPPPGSKTLSRALGQIMSHALAGQRRFGKDAITIHQGGPPTVEGQGPPPRYQPPQGPMTFQDVDLNALRGSR